MTTFETMQELRNHVAGIFGEVNVSELKFDSQQMRYHKERHYSFKIKDKTEIELVTSYDSHFNVGMYELSLKQPSQKNIGKNNTRTLKMDNKKFQLGNLTNFLHDECKMPTAK